jgi:DNA-directed RNA polymerase specialized sigma24 family protein
MSDDAFVEHRSLLFTVAYQMLGSAADAEDVVQETWLRWADLGDAARDEVRDPRAYLVRIVTREALNRMRTLASFLSQIPERLPGVKLATLLINGSVAVRIDPDGEFNTALTFAFEDGRISRIYAMRDPHRLERLHQVAELRR